jgi:signal transduction histidine kinase
MILKFDNFFTSGIHFSESELDLKSKFQMINIALILSSIALIYGILTNYIREISLLIPVELSLLCMNIILFAVLRRRKHAFTFVSTIITFQFTFFFLFLVYTNEPSSLKHVWLFTYPIILLFLQHKKFAIYWFLLTLFLLLIAPVQSFIDVSYSPFQVSYLGVVLIIISVIINFYQAKMQEARDMVVAQQIQLKEQLKEMQKKDQLLSLQSKQAVMGEMISMIAHQWRQPLSTVTLSISNLQIKGLLGEDIKKEELDKALENISDTVIYLSETIDDFQTYFHPQKELLEIGINELLQKAVNFVLPRLKDTKIVIEVQEFKDVLMVTYVNELIQVILNILNNAVDVLIEESVQNPNIIIDLRENEKNIEIVISDNASGISEENISRIFDPYFSTKGKNGTGLGLYMSQMIVEKQFNGHISVESSSAGTFFIVNMKKQLACKL